uniref:Uncharacterized protein n=1 Tax=Nomascus leucogenys TaxID=61853 RepID=A0A2I3HFY2_NOMLE
MYGPCLPDTRLLATRHRLRHLDLTQSPWAAGRRSFIICDVPADSPAQHLLVPTPACPLKSRIKLSRPTEIYGPILLSLNSHSSRKLRPLRADARSGSAATTVSSQGTKSAERKSRSTSQARGGHHCPVAAPAGLSRHPASVRPVCQGWHCPGKW